MFGTTGIQHCMVWLHIVAMLSLVLVWETDNRHFLIIFIICVHITHFIINCEYLKNKLYRNTDIFSYIIFMITTTTLYKVYIYF